MAYGGTAYYRHGNSILEATDRERLAIAEILSIPATMNGTAEFQIANVIAAIAACRAHQISYKNLARFQTFHSDGKSLNQN